MTTLETIYGCAVLTVQEIKLFQTKTGTSREKSDYIRFMAKIFKDYYFIYLMYMLGCFEDGSMVSILYTNEYNL